MSDFIPYDSVPEESLTPEQTMRIKAAEISAELSKGDSVAFHSNSSYRRTQTVLADAVLIYEWIMNG